MLGVIALRPTYTCWRLERLPMQIHAEMLGMLESGHTTFLIWSLSCAPLRAGNDRRKTHHWRT